MWVGFLYTLVARVLGGWGYVERALDSTTSLCRTLSDTDSLFRQT